MAIAWWDIPAIPSEWSTEPHSAGRLTSPHWRLLAWAGAAAIVEPALRVVPRSLTSRHERHQLHRRRHERTHHVAVLVLEDVAVVHVPARVGRELDHDLDQPVRVDPD